MTFAKAYCVIIKKDKRKAFRGSLKREEGGGDDCDRAEKDGARRDSTRKGGTVSAYGFGAFAAGGRGAGAGGGGW